MAIDTSRPNTGADPFFESLKDTQGIFNSIMKNRHDREQLLQEAKANEELNKYRMGELGVSQGRLALEKELGPLKLNLLREKIKAARHEGLPELTKANITQNQKVVQSVDNLVPQIDSLMKTNFPGQTIGKYVHPSDQADYDARIATLTDTMLSALNLPKTNSSIQMIDKMVRQKPFESKLSYKVRMENLKKDLLSRKKRSSQYLRNKNVLGLNEDLDNGGTEVGTETSNEAGNESGTNSLQQMAEEAIANGADREAVMARLAQLQGAQNNEQ